MAGASSSRIAAAGAFAVAVLLTAPAQALVEHPMLLAERFLPGAGWLEVGLLGTWGALVARLLLRDARTWRIRIWTLFSAVFFAQLALGLAGVDRLLQTGALHLPVPAVIAAGPIYRGGSLFMPLLLLFSLALVGPAWCSHLCYAGAWDQWAASARRLPTPLPRWRPWARLGVAAILLGGARALHDLGAPGPVATALGLGVGLLGVGIMATASRWTGSMVHCTLWCPIGLLATKIGLLSPFRIAIREDACTGCLACTRACRYDALWAAQIEARRPGEACTLCGDCLSACPHGAVEYRWAWLRGERARVAFVALVAGMHAAFLGLARI